VFDVVSGAFGEQGRSWRTTIMSAGGSATITAEKLMAELEDVQHRFEAAGGWQMQQKVDEILTRLKLPEDVEFSELSAV